MKVQELIDILECLDKPDAEVRLAIQPQWPFEHAIADVIDVEVSEHDCGGDADDEPCDACGQAPCKVDCSKHANDATVVYIGEGGQIGYLSGHATNALGWRR